MNKAKIKESEKKLESMEKTVKSYMEWSSEAFSTLLSNEWKRDVSWLDRDTTFHGIRRIPFSRIAFAVSKDNYCLFSTHFDPPEHYQWASQAEYLNEFQRRDLTNIKTWIHHGWFIIKKKKGGGGMEYHWKLVKKVAFVFRDTFQCGKFVHSGMAIGDIHHVYSLSQSQNEDLIEYDDSRGIIEGFAGLVLLSDDIYTPSLDAPEYQEFLTNPNKAPDVTSPITLPMPPSSSTSGLPKCTTPQSKSIEPGLLITNTEDLHDHNVPRPVSLHALYDHEVHANNKGPTPSRAFTSHKLSHLQIRLPLTSDHNNQSNPIHTPLSPEFNFKTHPSHLLENLPHNAGHTFVHSTLTQSRSLPSSELFLANPNARLSFPEQSNKFHVNHPFLANAPVDSLVVLNKEKRNKLTSYIYYLYSSLSLSSFFFFYPFVYVHKEPNSKFEEEQGMTGTQEEQKFRSMEGDNSHLRGRHSMSGQYSCMDLSSTITSSQKRESQVQQNNRRIKSTSQIVVGRSPLLQKNYQESLQHVHSVHPQSPPLLQTGSALARSNTWGGFEANAPTNAHWNLQLPSPFPHQPNQTNPTTPFFPHPTWTTK
ncbi:hypothetical protein RFI_11298 [Reticulomyxa filosa]|uniref:Uncharacterized protein n=1 Tax=Reticulomyxa filosa TaxID=46433 RepID=X6NJC5_RETFI|nr:hypothetical protein RFI_11298 [Reticulomyxa filosa]|eukprot:ETO25839.1 hypothetical protein RFI_11298 [Reticulomyxa filosa]